MPEYSFSYPSRGDMEDKMLNDVASVLASSAIDANTTQAVMLAVSEAFTNALVHGNRLNPEKRVILSLVVNDVRILADIEDDGRHGLEKISQRRPPRPLAESGRGIDLIKHYATDSEFTVSRSGGLKVSMKFDRKRVTNVNADR